MPDPPARRKWPSQRRSYRGLMRQPAWGLYDADGKLVGTIRARDAYEAREIFKEYGFHGTRVKRISD